MAKTEKKKVAEIALYQNKTVCESRVFEKNVLNDLSPKQIKILMLLASQIAETDTELKRYQISMKKLCEIFCKNTSDRASIDSVKKALADLRSKTVTFTYHLDEEGVTHKIDKITGWLDEIDIVDDKMIYFKMANWLKLYFLNIPKNQRVIYKIAYLFNLKKKGAINIYRWAYANAGFNNGVSISMKDAKLYFCGNSDKITKDFIRDYVEAGVQEINEKTDLHIDYKLNRKGTGRAYSSITFQIEKVKNIGSKLPDDEKEEPEAENDVEPVPDEDMVQDLIMEYRQNYKDTDELLSDDEYDVFG